MPKAGKDSIWIGLSDGTELKWLRNTPTRMQAMGLVRDVIADTLSSGLRLFAGFDFAFGYPAGVSRKIGGAPGWEAVWQAMSDLIVDDENNASNSFEAAGQLNENVFSELPDGPFWGHPHQHAGRYPGLLPNKPRHGFGSTPEYRKVERVHKGAKSLWQMAGAGVVGAQTMTGISHLQKLRNDPQFARKISVWPFETHFADDLSRPVIIGEIYPSIFDVKPVQDEVKDATQVRVVLEEFSKADAEGRFQTCLACPPDLDKPTRRLVEEEEGWIVQAPTPPTPVIDYVRDPEEIYRRSFEAIKSEVNLARFSNGMEDVAVRLIHACGMTDIVGDLSFSKDAVEIGRSALDAGAAIVCDVEMVRQGIIRKNLDNGNELLCAVGDDRVRALAHETGQTRSSAAIDYLTKRLNGSVVVIGNAPTALFRLLELMDAGVDKPALIIGMPVGFVGAVESKEALIENSRGVPYIAVRGRRGGSAMASATLNAIAAGLKGGL